MANVAATSSPSDTNDRREIFGGSGRDNSREGDQQNEDGACVHRLPLTKVTKEHNENLASGAAAPWAALEMALAARLRALARLAERNGYRSVGQTPTR